jgi:hypothetical protein
VFTLIGQLITTIHRTVDIPRTFRAIAIAAGTAGPALANTADLAILITAASAFVGGSARTSPVTTDTLRTIRTRTLRVIDALA